MILQPTRTARTLTARCAGAVAALLLCPAGFFDIAAPVAATPAPPAAKRLAAVKSWGYQLQHADPAAVAASPFDLVVIDYSRNGRENARFTTEDVKRMQTKPDGSRRVVLAYLSFGEAEDYRYYWDHRWVEPAPLKRPSAAAPVTEAATVRVPRLTAPGWLVRENDVWSGNYLVRYWYDGWQEIMMHGDTSYLARIQDAGFDGVYIDRVDAYYALEGDRKHAAQQMIDLVVELAGIARQRKPDFIVVPQNGEELLADQRYRAAIDGIAKEDLLLGGSGDGAPNDADRIRRTNEQLRRAKDDGLAVLAVEYTDQVDKIAVADPVLRALGYLPYFTSRTLDRLVDQTRR